MTPGTIGVCSGDLARFSDFPVSLMRCEKPSGTAVSWVKGADVTANCNNLARGFTGDWLWLMGDDHVFRSDLLTRLLAHNVDVVVPVCLKRRPPFEPVVYKGLDQDDGAYLIHDELPVDELVPVFAAGSAGMLVRRRVFDTVGDPWFESFGAHQREDLEFCRKVREAGFEVWCDTGAHLGHISTFAVWPVGTDAGWSVGLDFGNGKTLTLDPQPAPVT